MRPALPNPKDGLTVLRCAWPSAAGVTCESRLNANVLCLACPTSSTDETMPTPNGHERRSNLLGRLQQTSDRHDAAQATQNSRSNAADADKQLLADLRIEAEGLRTPAVELRGVVDEAKQVIEELRRPPAKPVT